MRHIDINGNSYNIDSLTVIVHHVIGGSDDLNAGGEPCNSPADLIAFIVELHDLCDAFSAETRDLLIADCTDD